MEFQGHRLRSQVPELRRTIGIGHQETSPVRGEAEKGRPRKLCWEQRQLSPAPLSEGSAKGSLLQEHTISFGIGRAHCLCSNSYGSMGLFFLVYLRQLLPGCQFPVNRPKGVMIVDFDNPAFVVISLNDATSPYEGRHAWHRMPGQPPSKWQRQPGGYGKDNW